MEDDRYPYSWIPPEDGAEHARGARPSAGPRRSPTEAEPEA